jgi:PAS domain S-box-containing protein
MPQPACLFSSQGELVEVNQAAYDLLGYTSPVPVEQLLSPQARDSLSAALQGGAAEYPLSLVNQHGHTVSLLVKFWQITDQWVGGIAETEDALVEILLDTTAQLTSTLNLDEVLSRILDNLEKVITFDTVSIMVIDLERRVARVIGSRGFEKFGLADWIAQLELPITEHPLWNRIIRTHEASVIPDVREFSLWISMPETEWIRSHIHVPIIDEERVIGFINLDSSQPGFFTKQHIRRLTPFGQQAAIAIHNARLFEAERQQRQLAESLQASALTLSSTLELPEVLNRILDSLQNQVPHDASNIMILEGDLLRTVGTRGYAERNLDEWIRGKPFVIHQYHNWARTPDELGDVRIVEDTHTYPHWIPLSETDWIRSHINVPILLDNQIIGFINLESTQPGAFNQNHAGYLQTYSHQAAIAIRNARLFEAERQQRLQAEALHESAIIINSTLKMDAVLQAILESAHKIVPFDAGDVMLYEDEALNIIASRGYEQFGIAEWINQVSFRRSDDPIWQDRIDNPRIIVVEDTQYDPTWKQLPETAWTRSYVGIPLLYAGELIGFLNLNSTQTGAFSYQQAEQLLPLANLAALATRNARLFTAEQEQHQFAQALIDINTALSSTLNLEQVFDLILEHADKVVPHDAANIMLIEGGVAYVVSSRGYDILGVQDWVSRLKMVIADHPIMKQNLENHQVYYAPDTRYLPSWVVYDEIDHWLRANLQVPIILDGKAVGLLNFDSGKPHAFSPADIERAKAFTDLAALAIRNARLFAAEHEQRLFAEALSEITIAVNSTLDLQEVFARILENLGHIIPHPASNIMLIQEGIARVVSRQGYEKFGVADWVNNLQLDVTQTYYMNRVMETGQAVIVSDITSDAHWTSDFSELRSWLRSHIKVPITLDGKIVGFLSLDSDAVGAFTETHSYQLQIVTQLASTAIRNAQMFTGEHQQRLFAEALVGVADTINRSLNLGEVLQQIIEQVQLIVPCDGITIMLIEDDFARIVSHKGFAERGLAERLESLRFPVAQLPDMQYVIHHKFPLLIRDTTAETLWKIFDSATTHWIRSHLKAPIIINDQVVGFLNLDSQIPNHFTPQHARHLHVFANLAAAAIRNARLFEAEHEERIFAEALIDVAATINSSLDLKEVLNRIMDHVGRMVAHDAMTIMLIDGEFTRTYSHRGFAERGLGEYVEQIEFRITDLPDMRQVVASRQPLVIQDTQKDDQWLALGPEDAWIRSHLKIPIQIDDTVVGFINIDSGVPNAFTIRQALQVQAFSDLAATAVRNARLYAELAQERAQLAAILEGTGEGILYMEGEQISYVNEALCHLTGYHRDELIGRAASLLFVPQFLTLPPPEKSQAPQTQRYDTRLRHKDGTNLDASITVSWIRQTEDNLPRAVILIQDISQEKKLRGLQMRFINHAAHEIRQPISTIAALQYLLGKNPDKASQYLARLAKSVDRLSNLSDHLTMVAEFNTGTVALNKTSLVLEITLAPILQQMQPIADAKQLDFNLTWRLSQTPILVDIVMLNRLMRLLLTDAFINSPAGGRVSVTFDRETTGGQDNLLIEIHDSRYPLTPEELEEIFQPFNIPSEGDRIHSGLELTLAKDIIDLHSGSIQASNHPAGGILFSVRLPLD